MIHFCQEVLLSGMWGVFAVTTLVETGRHRFVGGVYYPPEAARYLMAAPRADKAYWVTASKISRWIRRGLIAREMAEVPAHMRYIGFQDLTSARLIATLRMAGVSLEHIYALGSWLREYLESPYPFAAETLWTGRGYIFDEWSERLVHADRHGRKALETLQEYLVPIHGLAFDDATKIAFSWEPHPGVLLHAQIHSGAPCIKGTRIPTRAVAGAIEAGDTPRSVAKDYDISLEEVQAACDWESLIQSN